jgi:hypothetical protein
VEQEIRRIILSSSKQEATAFLYLAHIIVHIEPNRVPVTAVCVTCDNFVKSNCLCYAFIHASGATASKLGATLLRVAALPVTNKSHIQ